MTTTFPGNFMSKGIMGKLDQKFDSERFVFVGKDVKVLRRCCVIAGGSIDSIEEKTSDSYVSVCSKQDSNKSVLDLSVYVRFEKDSGCAKIRSKTEFEFVVLEDSICEKDLKRFLSIVSRKHNRTCMGKGTYFVSMTFSDIREVMSIRADWKVPDWITNKGGPPHDGLEFRADLLEDATKDGLSDSERTDSIMNQLALVRRCGQDLPIIYTVRSKEQGGSFPDDEKEAWKLMLLGVRFGVEYLDVEACWKRASRDAFMKLVRLVSPNTYVIGSYHAIQYPIFKMKKGELESLFHECAYGNVDIVKVVGWAQHVQDSMTCHQTAALMKNTMPQSVKYIVAIAIKDAGRLSRAMNLCLGPTPVAHPSFPGKAAPGQLSAKEIEDLRVALGCKSNPFR